MTHRIAWASRLLLGAALLLLSAAPAPAFITRLMPLKEVLSGQQLIFTAKVDSLAPDKPGIVLNADADLKGKAPFRRMPVNMTGDTEAQKNKHTEKLFKRLKPGLTVVIFAGQLGNKYVAFVYSEGTWFQILGQTGATPDKVVWSLVHGEPYLRRTYKGSTADLKQIVVDGLAKKKDPPEPNAKEEPGFGPEVEPDKKPEKEKKEPGTLAPLGGSRGPTFAVIPTVFIMGPLALLAALFPAVFGGLALFMKRWMAVLMVACTNSTLFTLHWWFLENYARGAWWGGKTTLWIVMSWIAFAGVYWSARRYRTVLHDNHSDDPMPRRGEQLVLIALSLVGLAVVAFGGIVDWHPLEWQARAVLATAWKQQMLIYWAGAWAGGLYLLYLKSVPRRSHAVPCEMIVLAGMLFACANLTTLEVASASQLGSGAPVGAAVTSDGEPGGARLERVVWMREIPGNGRIDSSPLVDGNRVYVAVSHAAGFVKYGIVYCLDRDSGKTLWQFDAQKDLKEVFSSPCIAGGKLYVGEGLHYDKGCRLFCVNAETGAEIWRSETESHVESSPCVGGGKVFVGAGDDGIVCCDAETGRRLWKYQPGLHVDASPTLGGNRVYAGSGVSQTYKPTAAFCLDGDAGTQKWRVDVDLPVWGSPTASGDQVFFGLGKGQIGLSAEPVPGAVLCLNAETGRRTWRCDVPDAVFTRPLVDEHRVYFGCRDGFVYGASRRGGKVLWKHRVGSQVVASPRLARSSDCDAVNAVFAVGAEGQVTCLDPNTGRAHWTFDLARHVGTGVQVYATPAVVVVPGENGDRRRIFVGAGGGDQAASTAKVFCLEDVSERPVKE